MKMAPIYSVSGQLLGHLNMEECGQNRHSVTVTDLPRPLMAFSPLDYTELTKETVRYCHVPLRVLRFHREFDEQQIRYLVADELPDWFWGAYATVKFSSDQWERP